MKQIIVLFAIIVLLAGCQTYQKESTAQSASQNMNADIAGFAFEPATIRVKAGDAVVWMHKDSAPHTVTSVSGPESFDSGTLNKGQTFSQTFTTPGTYEYECSIHPSMQGTVIVE